MATFHSLEGLSPEDQRLFNLFSRGPYAEVRHQLVHRAFEDISRAHADATAVRAADGRTVSYGELDRRANALAHELFGRYGVRLGDRVACVYARSIEMCVFLLAVMKAGGQYVPVDGAVVAEEGLVHIIRDSAAPVILCQPRFVDKIHRSLALPEVDGTTRKAQQDIQIVALDETSTIWEHGRDHPPQVSVQPADGAYVIYTSGTTGRPKGVDVRHEGACNTLLCEPSKLGITVGKNIASILNVSFDMGAWEILGTLMNGGTLHLRGSNRAGTKDNDAWADCLGRVDTVIATPSAAQKYFPRAADFPNIKTIAVGGEPCPRALADEWAPHAKFWNVCGPTEISILNTGHLHVAGGPLTIGSPNPNTNVYVLDDDENPVPIGKPGLMWAGGPGVSKGYLNLPELTRQRYKLDKFTRDG
jgi:non-ribosomal peptide synthetase component F